MDNERIKAYKKLMIFAAVLILAITNLDKVILALAYFFSIIRPFLIGAAIAFIINIPMTAIEEKVLVRRDMKGKQAVSYILAILAIVLVFCIVMGLVIPQLGVTVSDLGVKIPVFMQNAKQYLQKTFDDNPQIVEYLSTVDFSNWDWNSIINKAINTLGSGVGNMLLSTVSVAGSIFGVIVDGAIAFVFSIYILMQKEKLCDQFNRLMHAYLRRDIYEGVCHVLRLLFKNFTNYITSQCLEAVILGSMFVVSMLILRLPYALLIGALIMVTALIPIVGAFIGCIVGSFLILVDSPVKMLFFIILFFVLQQIEGNLIYPKVVGNSVGLPPIWVLAAVSIGGSLFGIVGMLVFIPITSTIYTLLREDVNRRNAEKNKKDKSFRHPAQERGECKASGETGRTFETPGRREQGGEAVRETGQAAEIPKRGDRNSKENRETGRTSETTERGNRNSKVSGEAGQTSERDRHDKASGEAEGGQGAGKSGRNRKKRESSRREETAVEQDG